MSENYNIEEVISADFEIDSVLDAQVGSVYQGASIDDTTISTKKTWSSKKISDELATKADATDMSAALALKANSADVTTALASKADTSTVNAALALKANSADVYTKTQTYSKTEVDAAMPSDASDIEFDDTYVSYVAGTVQGALNRITKSLTWAQYQALSTEEKNNGTAYFITDLGYPASDISYSNTTSELIATNVQSAIDELVANINVLTNLGLNYSLVTIQSAEYTESTLPTGS